MFWAGPGDEKIRLRFRINFVITLSS